MKQHKFKLLAVMISTGLLSACGGGSSGGSSDDDNQTLAAAVQAYDGPVFGMSVDVTCEDGSEGSFEYTDESGYVAVELDTFVNNPETCQLEFAGGNDAVDMETGKSMSDVVYKIPKGLITDSDKATASPLTTLIANKLGDTEFDIATATDILIDLGLGDLFNQAGVSILDLLNDTQAQVVSLEAADPEAFSELSAIKMILSDVITRFPNADADKIAKATNKLAGAVLTKYPNFPKNDAGESIFLDFKEQLEDASQLDEIAEKSVDELVDEIPAENETNTPDVDNPDSGGSATGGTGSSSNGGGTGD